MDLDFPYMVYVYSYMLERHILIPKLLDSRFLEEFIKVWEQEFIQVIPARLPEAATTMD